MANVSTQIASFLDDALKGGQKFRPDVREIVLVVAHVNSKGSVRGTAAGRWPAQTKRSVLERQIVAAMSSGRVYELRALFGEHGPQQQQEKIVLRPDETDIAPKTMN